MASSDDFTVAVSTEKIGKIGKHNGISNGTFIPSMPSDPDTRPPSTATQHVKAGRLGPDRVVHRLNKLFEPTKDLNSVLTTLNYSLHLLAYLDVKSANARRRAISWLKAHVSDATRVTDQIHDSYSSRFSKLAAVISNTRATLRLFGLLPIYVRFRQLIKAEKSMDHVLRAVGLVQCTLFGTFQLFENVAFLIDHGVLSRRLIDNTFTTHHHGLYRLAHRAWLAGVLCDFIRLVREAQLFFWRANIERGELTEEDAHKAAQWYYDWIQPLAWLPIGWQLSNLSENGVPGFNLGLQGVAGVLADLQATANLWTRTMEE